MSDAYRDHDPAGCATCARLGDWTTEQDTAEWLEAHARAGVTLRTSRGVDGTRVEELVR